MKRYSWIVLFFCCLALTGLAQQNVKIKGQILNNKFEKVELLSAYDDDKVVKATSVIDKQGYFYIQLTIDNPDLYQLKFADKEYLLMVLNPNEKIDITLDANNLMQIQSVTGSPSMLFVQNLSKLMTNKKTVVDSLNQALIQNPKFKYLEEFVKQIQPFHSTNMDINNQVVKGLSVANNLTDFASQWNRGVTVSADGLLKTIDSILHPYSVLRNYEENIRSSYDFAKYQFSNDYVSFGKLLSNYLQILDAAHENYFQKLSLYFQALQKIYDKETNEISKKPDIKRGSELMSVVKKISDTHQAAVKSTYESYQQAVSDLSDQAQPLISGLQNEIGLIVSNYQTVANQKFEDNDQQMMALMNQNLDNLAILLFLNLYPKEQFMDLHQKATNALASKYPDNRAVKERKAWMNSPAIATAVGAIAPDIKETKPDGTTMKLSDLRGKVVLLDFWASWCGPCRRANPSVVALYKKYKDQGFDVFSVSLDRDKNSWIAAIEKDGLIWQNHVSDLQYWSSAAAKLYGVSAIPRTFLIDKEGRIAAVNVHGMELEQKIIDLLK
jgi:thiol-disulfide isomerase/thioredoxin